jgi:mRNA interferase MazF
MVIERGEIWWADLLVPTGSEPGYRRPVVVIQADAYNRSRVKTVIVAALTSNVALAKVPGNVLLKASESGLGKDSVINVTQVLTLNRDVLTERAGTVPGELMVALEEGLRRVLDLW